MSPLKQISIDRLLPVLVADRAADATRLAGALVAGGLSCVEVTLRTDHAVEVIRAIAADSEMVIGAGTVRTPAQVDLAVRAGARFVVSPGFSAAVVRACQEQDVPVFPGVATATEIQTALDAGVETVKFFPAELLGGVNMIKALAAPFRSVRFIPTGGIGPANLAGYLAEPCVSAVGGTWMVAPDLLAAGRWDEVTRRTAAAVDMARA